MKDCRVIEAAPVHAALIAELHYRFMAERWSAEFVVRLLALPGAFALLAAHERTAEDEAAAFATILLVPGGEGLDIATFGVLPGMRRRGIGRGLLAEALARARDRKVARVYLEVRGDNIPAARLYREAGFRVTGRRAGYYPARGSGQAADALLMEYRIAGKTQN